MKTQELTPEVELEAAMVYSYWNLHKPHLYERAMALCLIEQKHEGETVAALAANEFEAMYNQALLELGLVIETKPKPEFKWRNGARIRA